MVAGSTIFACGILTVARSRSSEFRTSRFQTSLLLFVSGFLCIGLHQVFEFWAILTGNNVVYKTGLMCSISAMYFNVRGSLYFLGMEVHSRAWTIFFASMMVALGWHVYSREMVFENAHFYVRGESHFLWGGLWLFFFLFWNGIHIFNLGATDPRYRRMSLSTTFYVLNISFFLAALYCLSRGFYQDRLAVNNATHPCGGILGDFEIVFDAPSIWCVFAAIQGMFLFPLSRDLQSIDGFVLSKGLAWKRPVVFSLTIWLLVYTSLPLFSGLSYKMLVK